MRLTLVTDTKAGEQEIINDDNKKNALILIDESGKRLSKLKAPHEGWRHESLIDACKSIQIPALVSIDAFLGDIWIGSTEV